MKECIEEGCVNEAAKKRARCHGCQNNINRFSLTTPQRDEMLSEQDSKCSICEDEISFTGANKNTNTATVDHCHTEMRVRGILCSNCNTALGKFKDDKEILMRAMAYLDKPLIGKTVNGRRETKE